MASPVDAGRATTNISTAADPWTVNLPSSIVSGDLLVLFVRFPASTGSSVGATGWLNTLPTESPDAADDNNEVWSKTADGTEGATMSWDVNGSLKGAVIVWRVTGASAATIPPGDKNPEDSSATVTAAANINPASFTPALPGGSKDYLWLSLVGMDSETGTATNGTLSNVVSANSGTGGAVATNCIIWGGSLASTASSIDIAAWTSTAPASGASAYTIAVYPTTAAPPTLILEQGFVNFNDPGLL
jgi:hypothetical protein